MHAAVCRPGDACLRRHFGFLGVWVGKYEHQMLPSAEGVSAASLHEDELLDVMTLL
jgi:hypothetical protein